MRVRTDARRQAIVAAATEVFRDEGYQRASIAMIAAKVGGSKATLYGYFRSKEELFAAAMMEAMEEQGRQLVDILDPSKSDFRQVLNTFGEGYLRLVTSPDVLAVVRTAISEATNSKLGAELYARGPRAGWQELTTYMAELEERGTIRSTEPRVAAAHFLGLLEAGIVVPRQFGAEPEFELTDAVTAAIDIFIRAYADPAEGQKSSGRKTT